MKKIRLEKTTAHLSQLEVLLIFRLGSMRAVLLFSPFDSVGGGGRGLRLRAMQ